MSIWDQSRVIEGVGIAEDGRGIARAEGLELLVSDLLAGERARVAIEHRSPHRARAWARILERVGPPSPERVPPACTAFGQCGGCSWQHMSSELQLEEKRLRVERALQEELGGLEGMQLLAVPGPLACDAPLGYRNTGKYVLGTRDGELLLGSFKPRSHEIVSTLGCQVVEPAIDALARYAAECIRDSGLAIYDEQTRRGGLRYLLLRSNARGQVLVTLVCTSDCEAEVKGSLAARLQEDPRVCGVCLCLNDLHSGALLTPRLTQLSGTPLEEEILGVTVQLNPTAFFQVHRSQAMRAYADIAELLDLPRGARVMELYSGVGGIAIALAARGLEVIAVEREPAAVEAGQRALANENLAGTVEFRVGDVAALGEEDLRGVAALVVDPPRKGLGQSVHALCASGAPAIAYLSCGPESLARDLRLLIENGYRLEALRLYDFMPGTAQVETLALLVRG